MTTAVNYWRVYFRSVNTYNYGQLVFRTLQPRAECVNDFATPCFINLLCRVVLFRSVSFALSEG